MTQIPCGNYDHPLARDLIIGPGIDGCDALPNLIRAFNDGRLNRAALRALLPHAPASAILAIFLWGRGEEEVVVDPSRLTIQEW